jgi:predicted PurR-regulated permease PerM
MRSVPEAQGPSLSSQFVARVVITTALVAACLWVLWGFLSALIWATIFAIALWPLYGRLLRWLPKRAGGELAPLLLTAAIAIVFIAPVVLLGTTLAKEGPVVIEFIRTARHDGIQPPDWVAQLPAIGPAIADWWRTNLGDPATAESLFGRMHSEAMIESARGYSREIAHRVVTFFFTLLTVFFLFRDGSALTVQLRYLSDQLIGPRGERIAIQVIAAVHGTVTGLVLVGLAEGLILGVLYFAVGLPHSALLGAVTGVAAIIPFAAPVVYGLAGLYLFSIGNTIGAIVVLVAGSVVVFAADHFIRPFLIGGAARLPFLLVLLGILGGLESMGFLGLFVGPALMAAAVALWRELTSAAPAAEPSRSSARARPRRAG